MRVRIILLLIERERERENRRESLFPSLIILDFILFFEILTMTGLARRLLGKSK